MPVFTEEESAQTTKTAEIQDVGLWPEISIQNDFEYWMKMDNSKLQHCDNEVIRNKSCIQKDGDKLRKYQANFFKH